MNRLEVRTSKVTFVCAVLLGLIIVPLALGNLYHAISRGRIITPLLIGVPMLALLGAVLWIARRGHLRSVKCFTEEGLTRNDGRRFAWADLNCVVDQLHSKRGTTGDFIWRTEIQFKNGESAWLIPGKIANSREVREYVAGLPCEHKTVRV
jgi:hypothetical protein